MTVRKLTHLTVLFASKGNIHGNGQPHGFLREPYVYLQTPLWEGIPLTIKVPPPSGPTRYEGKTRLPQETLFPVTNGEQG